jgi:cytochrome c oxidase subunit II
MQGSENSNSSKRAVIAVALIWLVVTVLVEVWVSSINLHPFAASREAGISDEAFNLLVYLSIPVSTFVLIVIGYSLFAHRAKGDDRADGPPVRSHKVFIAAWIVITVGLSVYVVINPGFSGLDELRAEPEAELIIDISGERWNWAVNYVEADVQTQGTLVIPVDTRVLFRITATDVIHSFWIPAFRIKMDAVPGIVTSTLVTAEVIADYSDDPLMRVQCAELCGLGHARMWNEVEVMSQADFDAWLEANGA